jgi:hypothetical protein
MDDEERDAVIDAVLDSITPMRDDEGDPSCPHTNWYWTNWYAIASDMEERRCVCGRSERRARET